MADKAEDKPKVAVAPKKKEEAVSVKAAREKYETAKGTADEFAREVEYEAAKIEADEPAVGTAEATERAKEKVGHPDPFATATYVNGGE
jgi:hypothetical protein